MLLKNCGNDDLLNIKFVFKKPLCLVCFIFNAYIPVSLFYLIFYSKCPYFYLIYYSNHTKYGQWCGQKQIMLTPNISLSHPWLLADWLANIHETVIAYNDCCVNPSYHQTSNIIRTKTWNLNVSRVVLQFSFRNLLKPGVKSRLKLEQRRLAMPQLHLSDQQIYCLLICYL